MDLDIQKLVEASVKVELEEMDLAGVIEDQVRSCIKEGIGKEVIEQVKSKCGDMLEDEIRVVMDGEISTDDGWGKKETYPSFEALFKTELAKKMASAYEAKKTIERHVKERVDLLMKKEYNGVIEKIVDGITKSKLVKK